MTVHREWFVGTHLVARFHSCVDVDGSLRHFLDYDGCFRTMELCFHEVGGAIVVYPACDGVIPFEYMEDLMEICKRLLKGGYSI